MWNKLKAFLKWAVANDLKQPEDIAEQEGKAIYSGSITSDTVVEPEPVTERVRTRTIKGRYIADDKSTPDIDEAWTTRKVKVKRTKKYKK